MLQKILIKFSTYQGKKHVTRTVTIHPLQKFRFQIAYAKLKTYLSLLFLSNIVRHCLHSVKVPAKLGSVSGERIGKLHRRKIQSGRR